MSCQINVADRTFRVTIEIIEGTVIVMQLIAELELM